MRLVVSSSLNFTFREKKVSFFRADLSINVLEYDIKGFCVVHKQDKMIWSVSFYGKIFLYSTFQPLCSHKCKKGDWLKDLGIDYTILMNIVALWKLLYNCFTFCSRSIYVICSLILHGRRLSFLLVWSLNHFLWELYVIFWEGRKGKKNRTFKKSRIFCGKVQDQFLTLSRLIDL